MNLHEYQAKEILKKYQIPMPAFEVAHDQDSLQRALQKMNLDEAVLKIQIHAGGRGKAGGVKRIKGQKEILKQAEELFGMKVVNTQTGPAGLKAEKILVTQAIEIDKEYYLSFLIDRKMANLSIVASSEGGMEIEEIARKNPEKILKMPIASDGTLKPFQIRLLCQFLKWEKEVARQAERLLANLTKAFYEEEATLLEINPLVLTKGMLSVLDVKMIIDDNALFRHEDLEQGFDYSQCSPGEALARKADLSYISLQGDIGCMVNGAGLAMATMDLIQLHGGMPANFLDVGGSATKEKISDGFKIILQDANVKAIFINIFGGIMNCALLASGIVEATKQSEIKIPLIVRLEGNAAVEGMEILHHSGLAIITAKTMEEGAVKAVVASGRQSCQY